MGAKKYETTTFPVEAAEENCEIQTKVGDQKAHLYIVPTQSNTSPEQSYDVENLTRKRKKSRSTASEKQLGPVANFLVDILASIIVGFIMFFLLMLVGSLKVTKSETKK